MMMTMTTIVYQMRWSPSVHNDQVLKETLQVHHSLMTRVNCSNGRSASLSTPINWSDAQRHVDVTRACPICTSIYPVCSFFILIYTIRIFISEITFSTVVQYSTFRFLDIETFIMLLIFHSHTTQIRDNSWRDACTNNNRRWWWK